MGQKNIIIILFYFFEWGELCLVGQFGQIDTNQKIVFSLNQMPSPGRANISWRDFSVRLRLHSIFW